MYFICTLYLTTSNVYKPFSPVMKTLLFLARNYTNKSLYKNSTFLDLDTPIVRFYAELLTYKLS